MPHAPDGPATPRRFSQQRDRASMEAWGGVIKFSSGVLRQRARETFRADPDGASLKAAWAAPDALQQMPSLVAKAREVAERDHIHRLERFCQRMVAEEGMAGRIGFYEARRDQVEAASAGPRNSAGGTLELDPELKMPAYFDGVEYHLQPGGWDGYDLYAKPFGGPDVNIYKYAGYAAVPYGSDIYAQRVAVAKQLRNPHPARLYEIGCGQANTLPYLHKVYPDAELVGCDLSRAELEKGHEMLERSGIPAHLKQRDCRETGEPDDSFDGVFSYAIHHEAPFVVNIEMFREIFRILKPGGELVISDPPPFRAVEPFHAAILDWDTDHREEPYFSEACLSNWDEELRRLGFVDVESYALGPDGYPWVTRARKPS